MNLSKLVLPAILLAVTLIFGFIVSKTGKPYNTFLFTIHKLLALAAVVLAVIQVLNLLKVAPAQGLLIGLLILAVICVITLFATGAIMSAQKELHLVWRWVHGLASLLLAGSSILLVIKLLQS